MWNQKAPRNSKKRGFSKVAIISLTSVLLGLDERVEVAFILGPPVKKFWKQRKPRFLSFPWRGRRRRRGRPVSFFELPDITAGQGLSLFRVSTRQIRKWGNVGRVVSTFFGALSTTTQPHRNGNSWLAPKISTSAHKGCRLLSCILGTRAREKKKKLREPLKFYSLRRRLQGWPTSRREKNFVGEIKIGDTCARKV